MINISQIAQSIRLLCYAILLAAPDLLAKGAFQLAMRYVQERGLMTSRQADLFKKMYIPGPNPKMIEEVFTSYHLSLQGAMLKRIFQKGGLHQIPAPAWFALALSRRGVGRKAASDAGGFSDIPSSDWSGEILFGFDKR
jgi:hypothetical protein